MRKTIAISVGSLLALSALGVAVPAQASHSWGGYHWARTANPLNLKLGDNLSSAWDPYLVTSSNDWSSSSVLNTAIVAGGTTSRLCKATSGRVEACNYKYGNNGWLGIAQIWISGTHITKGLVKVNDTYFSTVKYNTPAWRNLVMCQEVAHTFGLNHQDEAFNNFNLGSCMDYTNAPAGGTVNGFNYGPSNEHPNAHDYAQLETIYAHLDSFTSSSASKASAGAAPAADVDVSARAEWGKVIRTSSDGRASLYARELSPGQKVLTFVIWAD